MTPFDPRASAQRSLRIGAVTCAILVVGVGGVAGMTELSGAVVAQGLLVVDSNVKKVQHPSGGVVGQLLVRDGSRVKAGDLLVKLDDTQTRANLGIVVKQLDELAARQAREEAERDGDSEVVFPGGLTKRADDVDVARLIGGETRLFAIRKAARDGQKAQLRDEIEGLDVQRRSRVTQIEWIEKELNGVRDLWNKKLVPYTKLTSLEREAARLEGERGQLISSIAQSQGKIAQIDQDLRAEVGRDLAEIRGKTAELMERKVAAEDLLNRVDIRSPQDGVVHQSSVHTVGGVVNAGEPVMLVVPETEALTAELRIAPQDIDQIRLGQPAALKFSAFNQRITPEIEGTISRISADVSQDAKTGAYFYTARIAVSDAELAKLGPLKLMAGMPVEAFVKTEERSVISYLTKPIRDQVARAFREK